jgi:hypothetical protein
MAEAKAKIAELEGNMSSVKTIVKTIKAEQKKIGERK